MYTWGPLFRNIRTHIILLCLLLMLYPVYDATSAESKTTITPEEALAKLKYANNNFQYGIRQYPNLQQMNRILTAEKGQTPFVTILSCSDSRVPVEHIFDAGIGDIFVVRVAGNVAGIDEIATIEYGVEHLGTPLLVVMGHSKCGAVTAVAKGDHAGGNIPRLLSHIEPAVKKAKKIKGNDFSPELVNEAIKENVQGTIESIISKSPIVRELVEEKKLTIQGAIYDIASGQVQWLPTGEEEKKSEGKIDKIIAKGLHLVRVHERYIFAACSGLITLILLIMFYRLFFGSSRTKKIRIRGRIFSGYLALVFTTVIAGFGAFVILNCDAVFYEWKIGLAVVGIPVLLSLIFAVTFTSSIVKSFHTVIDALKSQDEE